MQISGRFVFIHINTSKLLCLEVGEPRKGTYTPRPLRIAFAYLREREKAVTTRFTEAIGSLAQSKSRDFGTNFTHGARDEAIVSSGSFL